MKKRNPEKELRWSQYTHDINPTCKRCHGTGHNGKLASGAQNGLYIPCKCAK